MRDENEIIGCSIIKYANYKALAISFGNISNIIHNAKKTRILPTLKKLNFIFLYHIAFTYVSVEGFIPIKMCQ